MGFYLVSVVLLGVVSALYLVSFWISAINNGSIMEKLSAYECGLEPVGDARVKFDILYYIIGILYLIFDLEIIFLFPLATILFSLNS
jgi:NADH:ubiquinone oxidoreductase subunit 3 (subunit A)